MKNKPQIKADLRAGILRLWEEIQADIAARLKA